MNALQAQKLKEQTRKTIPLLQVIRKYGYEPKQDSDDHMTMLCPFHNERTPSFKIYLNTNSFFCYGCDTGGSVIDFIAHQEKLSIDSVLEEFSKTIDVTSIKFAAETISQNLKKPIVEGNKYRQDMHFEVRVWLRDWLKKHPGHEEIVDDCFREMRMFFYDTENVDDQMIKQFSDYVIKKVSLEV